MIGFCGSFPMLILGPFGGVYADRIDRRKLLIIGGGTEAVFLLLLATLTATGLITIWHIVIIALLSGVAWAMSDPSRMALVPNLVTPDDLMNAIALNSTAWNTSRLVGPALAGVLIGLIDIGGCFYFAGISCTVAVAVLFFVAQPPSMPVFARDILGVGVSGYSQLMAATGAGALLGALTVASLGDFRRKGWLLVISALFFATTTTLIQSAIPDELRGRVMGLYTLTWTLTPIGSMLAGAAITIIIGGFISTLFILGIIIRQPSLRKL